MSSNHEIDFAALDAELEHGRRMRLKFLSVVLDAGTDRVVQRQEALTSDVETLLADIAAASAHGFKTTEA